MSLLSGALFSIVCLYDWLFFVDQQVNANGTSNNGQQTKHNRLRGGSFGRRSFSCLLKRTQRDEPTGDITTKAGRSASFSFIQTIIDILNQAYEYISVSIYQKLFFGAYMGGYLWCRDVEFSDGFQQD